MNGRAGVRITHFVENLNRGGLERVVLDLVGTQHAQGHECEVICLFERGALADQLAALGVAVHACGKRNGLDLGAVARARRLLRRRPPEVLHTHNMAAHYHAVLGALGLPIRRIVNTRHGMGSVGRPGRRDWLYARTMRRTDAVVAVCETARADLAARSRLPAAKLAVVRNGIRIDAFEPRSAAARARLLDTLALPPQARPIGFVGRLNWAKDLETLLHAFRAARAEMPELALILVGDGERRRDLVALAEALGIAEATRFLGDRSDVAALLAGFEAFALSSVTEGYSIALLEACAAALPIYATDVGGNREIVRDGVNGRVVPARDPAAFAEALTGVLRDPLRAQALGQAGRAWIEAHGTLAAMAAGYARVYLDGPAAAKVA